MHDPRSDHEWLDARERGEPVDHIASEVRARYDNLERYITELPPEGWQGRVLAGVAALEVSRRRRRVAWGIAGAIAVAAVIVLVVCWPSAREQLAIEIVPSASVDRQYMGEPASRTEGMVNDTLRVRGAPAVVELRVYPLGGRAIARCPGGPHCTPAGAIELVLEVPGPLEVLGLSGCTPPAPSGDRADDEVRARAAHCEIALQLVKVR